MTIKYRVTMTNRRGDRVATEKLFDTKTSAYEHADATNRFYFHANARVVKDSERIRRMIP